MSCTISYCRLNHFGKTGFGNRIAIVFTQLDWRFHTIMTILRFRGIAKIGLIYLPS